MSNETNKIIPYSNKQFEDDFEIWISEAKTIQK
jgi:hypothetical protein